MVDFKALEGNDGCLARGARPSLLPLRLPHVGTIATIGAVSQGLGNGAALVRAHPPVLGELPLASLVETHRLVGHALHIDIETRGKRAGNSAIRCAIVEDEQRTEAGTIVPELV